MRFPIYLTRIVAAVSTSAVCTMLEFSAPNARGQAGAVDPSFVPALPVQAGVWFVLPQPDGRLLVATLNVTNDIIRLIRLKPDASLDTSFDARFDNPVFSLALQPDGRILAGGVFSGQIARLNADGSFDTAFTPGQGASGNFTRAVAVQDDGKILIGGAFSTVNGVGRNGIARLNADGSLDTSFNPGSGVDFGVNAITVLADQKILIAGGLRTYNGTSAPGVTRLKPDGSLDSTFVSQLPQGASLEAMVVQPDGKIIVGGYYPSIARLNPNGSLDASFQTGSGFTGSGAFNLAVRTIALQPDGKILVGGNFIRFNGEPAMNLVRLNPNGSLDPTFDAGNFTSSVPSESTVLTAWVQADGRIVIGGAFDSVRGVARPGLARLLGGPDGQSLSRFEFSQATYSASEGSRSVTVTVNRLRSRVGQVSVDFATGRASFANYDATAGADYTPTNDTLVFRDGETNKSFTLQVADDEIPEPLESFGVLLTNPSDNAILGVRTNADVTILDNDRGVGIFANETTLGEAADRFLVFVSRQGVLTGSVQVDVMTVDGTAKAGEDYVPHSERLTFGPNDGGKLIEIRLLKDSKAEGTETFSVVLTNAAPGVALSSPPGIELTILDDDGPGSVDQSFSPNIGFSFFGPRSVDVLAVQSDGRIYVAGNFTNINGVPRGGLARVDSKGEVDTTFSPSVSFQGRPNAVATQADGKILLAGGYFSFPGGSVRNDLAQLNADGSPDGTFDAKLDTSGSVVTIALQEDGKILLGGGSFQVQGKSRRSIARILANGTLDESFDPGSGANGAVTAIALQTDGKILIAGLFDRFNNHPRAGLARLNSNGELDASWTPPITGRVNDLLLQPDGKIVVAGSLGALPGGRIRGVVRLNPEGTLDSSFSADSFGFRYYTADQARVNHIERQADGKLIVAGSFDVVGDFLRFNMARLNADGSVDPSFLSIDLFRPITSMALTPTGELYIGGELTFEGNDRSPLRLTTTSDPNYPGRFEFSARFYRTMESTGVAKLEVLRLAGSKGVASVRYYTTNEAASSGIDYVARSGTLEFADGEVSRPLEIPIIADSVIERAETFAVALGRPEVGALGLQTNAQVQIIDHTAGSLDSGFTSSIKGTIRGLAVAPGDKLLVLIGDFFNHLWRLNADGTVDSSFVGQVPEHLQAWVASTDGSVYYSGGTGLGEHIGKLRPDGSSDPSFVVRWGELPGTMLAQADGKLLFQSRRHIIVRIHPDGSDDPSFNSEVDAWPVALQPDGKILVQGYLPGSVQRGLFRLHRDGKTDPEFQFFRGNVAGLVDVLPDGKILLLGETTNATTGIVSPRALRLNAEGSLDPTFVSPVEAVFGHWAGIKAQSDGRLLVWGDLTYLQQGEGRRSAGLLRLNDSGSIDPTFDPNAWASHLVLQSDGRVVVAGSLIDLDGLVYGPVLRLLNDYPGAGALQFAPASRVVTEGATDVSVRVQRMGSSTGLVQVNYDVSGGSSTSETDFVLSAGTLTFADGDRSEKSITLRILDDAIAEGTETIIIWLANPIGGATLGAQAATVLNILDDDTAVELAAPGVSVNESAGSAAIIVRRLGATNTIFKVDLATGDDTARTGSDFQAVNSTLTFAAGENEKVIRIPLVDDDWSESDKTFYVTLSNPNGVLLGANIQAAVRIIDSDRPGQLDPSFDIGLGVSRQAYGGVRVIFALAVQADGKILLGGDFDTINGIACSNLTRLHADGSVDLNFIPPPTVLVAFGDGVRAIQTRQSDSAIFAAGRFSVPGCATCSGLIRLRSDGTVDTAFRPNLPTNAIVLDARLTDDGKLFIGGEFVLPRGEGKPSVVNVARLNQDGSVDFSFDPSNWIHESQGVVRSLTAQSDGKVLVGLLSTRPSIARLNPDGSLDLGFKAGGPGLPFGIGSVERMLLQTDGRLLIAGDFTVFSDEPRPGLVRLNPDGSLDQSFVPGFKNGDVRAIGLQPDGKVLVGGLLTLPEEHKPVTIVRLNADGSLDRWFDPGRAISEGVGIPLARVTALALQSDGQVLVAGQFNKINGVVRNGLARLNGGEPLAVRSVSRLGDGRVQLQGTVPRSHSYIFEASSDLIQWIPIHTNSIPAGTFQLVDDEAAQLGRRFYRLKAQP